MRYHGVLVAAVFALAACSAPLPPASDGPPGQSLGTQSLETQSLETPASPVSFAATPSPSPAESVSDLAITIVNRSSLALVVSVANDVAGAMPGFLPGQQGTVVLPLGAVDNGIGVEVYGASDCKTIASAFYPSEPLTLFVDDDGSGVRLSAGPIGAASPAPLPANSLRCPGG